MSDNAYVSKNRMEEAFRRMYAERKQWRREVYFMRVVTLAAVVFAAWSFWR